MSTGYQIYDQYAIYFLTFTIVDWVDIFSRKIYRDIVIDSLNYSINAKGLMVYGYVIMTNHVHVLFRSVDGNLSAIVRDFKKYTAYKILESIKTEPESRREWLLHRFSWNAAQHTRNHQYQVWSHDNHAIEIRSKGFFFQKLNYTHFNPVRAGWVLYEDDYVYSSAAVLAGKSSAVVVSQWLD